VLELPTFLPAIAYARIYGADRGTLKKAVLRQRSRADVAIFERAKPACRLAQFQSRRRDNRRGVDQEVSRLVTKERTQGGAADRSS